MLAKVDAEVNQFVYTNTLFLIMYTTDLILLNRKVLNLYMIGLIYITLG